MCKVRPSEAIGVLLRKSRYSANGMANCARGVGKDLCSRCGRASSGFHWHLKFVIDPLLKIFGCVNERPKSHIGVRISAKLCALPVVFSGHIRDQCNLILLPGNDVAFPTDLRDEETMNYVFGEHREVNRLTRRNVNLISGLHPQRRIMELPPPLMSDHF